MNKIASNILTLRKRLGYTQQKTALLVGISPGTWQILENGLRMPTKKTVRMIEKYFFLEKGSLNK